mmetsp:Transcript_7804/g.19348  ORF Transcript_7804/g.19348 Transcript_7804/m.19348 type:complete len:242 (+) Transcript_7804:55-780(+)|eukprot:CAMPEP_0118811934 /NCGR_PEP_ID=MMETSP1162-20130426/1992_1 /TAXON_ID=33656 /ORGANISM="Phaeocystis Sp, Strain CCMP2710" /LENGTH=241 /DNA_ID=CAMNT_0006741619 /DNA_START=52 /DNA_END=777 /DNA_ORIENTATION=-
MALTLHYFPLRARAEPLKMILGHCKISYVDRQVPFAEWGAWKASGSVPPGKTGGVQLPVLELEDGTFLPESLDIAKHVWTLAGKPVTGTADLLWALNDKRDGPFNSPDFVVAGLVNPLLNWFSAEDAAPKIPPHVAGFPAFFEYLAPLLDEEPGPFFGGAEPSYGDFQIFHIADNLSTLDGGATMTALEATQPALTAWYQAMLQLPAVADHLAARPKPGSGEVGRPGSLIATYTVPHSRTN